MKEGRKIGGRGQRKNEKRERVCEYSLFPSCIIFLPVFGCYLSGLFDRCCCIMVNL